jgi:hypothetical protein
LLAFALTWESVELPTRPIVPDEHPIRLDDEGYRNPHRLRRGPQAVERVVAVVDQISRRLVPWKRLAKLLGRSRSRWMCGDRHVPDASPIVGEKYQDEQESVGRGRDHEEIRCDDLAIVRMSVRTSADTVGRPMRPSRWHGCWRLCSST